MNTTRWDFERAVTASTLPAPSRLILLVLATRADTDTGRIPAEYSPSHARLAQDTGLSRRTVIDHLAAVETAGWLTVKRAPVTQQRTQHTPNTYRLALPKTAAKLVQQLHTEPPKASAAPAPAPRKASATAAPAPTRGSATAAPGASAGAAQASATAAHNQNKELTTNHQAPSGASRTSAGAPAHEHTRARLAELNDTAVRRPDAYALVSTWAQALTTPIRTETQRALAKHVDQLLADLGPRADLTTLRAALDDWANRGRTPGFIINCYDDAARATRAALTSQDVPGSRVQPPAKAPTRRLAKALAALHPDDPARAELLGAVPSPPALRMIEGKSA